MKYLRGCNSIKNKRREYNDETTNMINNIKNDFHVCDTSTIKTNQDEKKKIKIK